MNKKPYTYKTKISIPFINIHEIYLEGEFLTRLNIKKEDISYIINCLNQAYCIGYTRGLIDERRKNK